MGLSPRVRGNRRHATHGHRRHGSIPACAGEPWRTGPGIPPVRVYPRVCGGTLSEQADPATGEGLSPRVRGNLRAVAGAGIHAGSIPACAGEPTTAVRNRAALRVYPRVCGGTHWSPFSHPQLSGLSPRVRGNPCGRWMSICIVRSIPACAGEPWPHSTRWPSRGVYPRVCGGTLSVTSSRRSWRGLSPRVRGNRHVSPSKPWRRRSIPACAGEPVTGG